MTIEQKLRAIAQELREKPERWTQGAWARDKDGNWLGRGSANAVSCCMVGHVHTDRFSADESNLAWALLERVSGLAGAYCASNFNDAPGRTASEIADAFDRAADFAAAELAKAAQ